MSCNITLSDETIQSLFDALAGAGACACACSDRVSKAGDVMTGPLTVPNGTVAAPSINFAGQPTTGIYLVGENTIGLSSHGLNLLTASLGGGFQIKSHVTAPSGNIAGSLVARSLGVSEAFSVEFSTYLARNNSGALLIGNAVVDPNDPSEVMHKFLGNGNIGFYKAEPVPQQSASTLEEVITALKNYGLLT